VRPGEEAEGGKSAVIPLAMDAPPVMHSPLVAKNFPRSTIMRLYFQLREGERNSTIVAHLSSVV
jgi:hypothetical protein